MNKKKILAQNVIYLGIINVITCCFTLYECEKAWDRLRVVCAFIQLSNI